MPDNYWQTFAQKLDSQIDIFWTGEKVCSPDYTREHLLLVDELIGRKPFLWDNYPVNDGAVKSNLLQLRAFTQSHAQLEGHVAGQRGFADLAQDACVQQVVFAHLGGPLRKARLDRSQHVQPGVQLDFVALAVVESQGFNAVVLGQSMGQAGGGVLTTRKQDKGGGVHGLGW